MAEFVEHDAGEVDLAGGVAVGPEVERGEARRERCVDVRVGGIEVAPVEQRSPTQRGTRCWPAMLRRIADYSLSGPALPRMPAPRPVKLALMTIGTDDEIRFDH